MNKHDICRYIYDSHDITIGSELSQSMIFGFMIRDDVSLIDGTTAGLDFRTGHGQEVQAWWLCRCERSLSRFGFEWDVYNWIIPLIIGI